MTNEHLDTHVFRIKDGHMLYVAHFYTNVQKLSDNLFFKYHQPLGYIKLYFERERTNGTHHFIEEILQKFL